VSARWLLVAAAQVAVRPGLWLAAVRQVFVLARPGWWRQAPFLPLPDRAYLRFRLVTAYGDPDREPEPHDLVTYLHWCKEYGALKRPA
jgi:hypothetical protein